VNTDAHYERHLPEQPAAQTPPTPPTEAELSALARHGDPSLTHRPEPTHRSSRGRSIAWMRPSELATTITTPIFKRGADVQAELARQVRRAPSSAARAGRRVTRSAIAQPGPTTPTREGLGL
jgi:hypothetical protein